MRLLPVILFLILISDVLSAQTDSSAVTLPDSTETSYGYKLNPGFGYNPSALSLLGKVSFYEGYNSYIPDKFGMEKKTPYRFGQNFRPYKDNLMNALGQIQQFKSKNDLGMFGTILGYTNAAAAGYLLYLHLKKYGHMY